MPEEQVNIPKKQFEALQKDSRKLAALEAGGVDNWEWYGQSLEEFWAEENDD